LEASGRRDILPVLGNVSRAEYERYRHHLSNESGRRAEHFFSEQDRVHQGIQAWCRGDLATFGQLMTESGWSSIRNYECGAPPLIELFEILLDTPGVLGTRFSGAGFRGCCVAFVHDELAEEACQTVMDRYSRACPELARNAQGFLCDSSNGIELLT
jgi:galacturonokinase